MRNLGPAKWMAVAAVVLLAACSADGGGSDSRINGGTRNGGSGGSAGFGGGAGGTGGSFVPGGGGGVGPSSGDPGGGASDDGKVCATVNVTANRITPRVTLVVDGSTSMAEAFGGGGGGGTRWQALRNALLGQNGVVRDLEGIVEFGLTIYSAGGPMGPGGPGGGGGGGMMCPSLIQQEPAVNNFQPINQSYPQREPGGVTPTGEALQAVVDSLEDQSVQLDQSNTGEQIIVLATDGAPNGCEAINQLDPFVLLDSLIQGQPIAIETNFGPTEAAVTAAQEKAINTYVISLAPGLTNTPENEMHLQKVANIGQGLDPAASPGAQIFTPTDPTQLAEELRGLVGDVVGCDLQLQGELVVDRACSGDVLLNGQELECDGPNGWEVVNASTIRLLGSACEEWKNNAEALLDAQFPCDVVEIE